MLANRPILALLLTAALGSSPALAQPLPSPVFNGETMVPPGGYVAWCVQTEGPFAKGAVLVGRLKSGGAGGGPFAVAVLNQANFESWRKGYRPDPYYSARRVKQVELRTRLPKPGTYYVVVSNPAPATSARIVRGSLQLFRAPSTAAAAAASGSTRPDARRDLLSFGAVLALAGALALWSILDGKRTDEIEAENRAA